MPLIENVQEAWSNAEALVTGEMWQLKKGRAYLARTAGPGDNTGIELRLGEAVYVPAGDVFYRGEAGTIISREPWDAA